MGVMGVWLAPMEKPSFFMRRWRNFVFDQSFLISFSPTGESSNVNAAWHVATTDGGCPVEYRNGRARRYRKSTSSREPHTYPPIEPIALLSVPPWMVARPRHPSSSTVPRPLRPSPPEECASSTIMMQLYFSARSHSAGSGAISPSIEKTPSVINNLWPGQFSVSLQRRSQSATSLCLKTLMVALESRQPSMMEA